MKKNILLVLVLCLCLVPMYALASTKKIVKEDYKSMNLEQVLEEEKIEVKFKDYEENDKQITIYLFRGNGCGFCKSFLNFLNEITDEYGNYFKLESYEVWTNSKNSKLFEEVSEFLDQPAQGVPYIIIGDNVFPGYAEQYDEGIKSAIMDLYENEERYDVFVEMAKAYDEANKVDYSQTIIVIIFNFIFIAIATTLVLIFINNKDKKISQKIEELKIISKEEIKETKKVLKTTSNNKTTSKNKKESKKI